MTMGYTALGRCPSPTRDVTVIEVTLVLRHNGSCLATRGLAVDRELSKGRLAYVP